jgi:hypothetical protein
MFDISPRLHRKVLPDIKGGASMLNISPRLEQRFLPPILGGATSPSKHLKVDTNIKSGSNISPRRNRKVTPRLDI